MNKPFLEVGWARPEYIIGLGSNVFATPAARFGGRCDKFRKAVSIQA
jgi:hypothetical protein